MDEIFVENYKVIACHGVNEEEKTEPQPFVFSAKIGYDMTRAAASDDIRDAVSYASVCKVIKDIAEKNSFNLLERLATECAYALFETFEKIETIKIWVNKPKAPMNGVFDGVGVKRSFRRVQAIVAMGSSEGDKKGYLDAAADKMDEIRGVRVEAVSSYMETEPWGGAAKNMFLNAAALIETYLQPEALLCELQRIEAECGRVRDVRWGDRTLDLDIVFYGDEIVSTRDLSIPHPEWSERDFVLGPVCEIAPSFLDPVSRKRVSDYKK